ncbi:restriction endonuclease subunit S [uncultured Sneathiella sp.]|uniref:restriction endonuclease subunit S n=1 Tax=uncultured Sneathiella sp. TaxID=879315 RepID=UPI0025988F16|nr:restriction endonuclease subunit S [uncultured Sneathiella sp.]
MSWDDAELQDLVLLQRGFDITKAEQRTGDVPVISSSGPQSFHNEAKVKGPGVIVGRKGSVGTVYYSEADFWPHDTTLWSKDLKGNHPKFVYYFLQTLQLNRFDTGNSNPTLNRNHIHKLPIKKPNFEEQKRIAELLTTYDDLIENNRRRIALLEEAARLLYREWFVHFRFPGHEHVKTIDGVPEGWKQETFDSVCETIGGGTPSTKVPEYWNDADVTWITPTDITRNNCLAILDGEKKISEAGLKKSSAKLVPPYTILMTSRASVGFFGLIDREVCTNQGFINIIPNVEVYRYYLLFNLIHRVDEIRSHAGGSTYAEISKGKFRALPVTIPTSDLLEDFDERVRPVLDQVRVLKKQSDAVAKARDFLLPRLMDGRLEI